MGFVWFMCRICMVFAWLLHSFFMWFMYVWCRMADVWFLYGFGVVFNWTESVFLAHVTKAIAHVEGTVMEDLKQQIEANINGPSDTDPPEDSSMDDDMYHDPRWYGTCSRNNYYIDEDHIALRENGLRAC